MRSVQEPVMEEMKRDGLLDLIGRDHVFAVVRTMLAAYDQGTGGSAPAGQEPLPHDVAKPSMAGRGRRLGIGQQAQNRVR